MAPKRAPPPQEASLSTLVIGDFVVTLLWLVASSCFAEASEHLAKLTGLEELLLAWHIFILITALTLFGPVCNAFGGALFNPLNNLALLGSGKSSVAAQVVRMCAQLAGAMTGSIAAKVYLPEFLHGKFHTLSGGIKDGVAFELGFAAEGIMSLVLNYVFLVSLDAKSRLLTLWTPMLSTVILSWVGFYFTGPSLNPFVSFSWHMHYKSQDDLQHYLVFWSAPILGALFAGWIHYLRHMQPVVRKGRRPSRAAIQARGQWTQQQHSKEL
ncbi:putative aquaporin SIP1-2 [Tetrabaena socialis]|uniref:Putative aquaporin SIP1-2 n=1 Tax=Tetrabaena socialis TaxID=47790 RepID=A0A2J8A5Q6_9CHLO|nr:putative aquaporin SIP1-2 [Tetrabaena socialis]|eukprot:PNH07848.1 putative aquaporin SIP1-2 [Tetrabaena socialis]